MKRMLIPLLLVLHLAAPAGRADVQGPLLDAVRDGQDSIRAWTFERITNAAMAVANAGGGEDVFWRDYWEGCLFFHAVVFLREQSDVGLDVPDASPYRERALEALHRAVGARPSAADAHAMISVLNGMAIDDNPLAAIKRGPALLRHKRLALKSGDNDPRTKFLMGVSTFKRAGGSRKEIETAAETLNRALQLFDQQAGLERPPWEPRWGRDHTLLFLGRVEEALARYEQAGGWYEKAFADNNNLTSAAEGMERCRKLTEKQ